MGLACNDGDYANASNDGDYGAMDGDGGFGPVGDDDDDDDDTAQPSRDDSGEQPGTDQGGETDPQFEPAPARLRRLLARQYVNSVGLLLGPQAGAVAEPPLDPEYGTLKSVTAGEASLSATDVAAYETSADAIADVVTADAERLAELRPCEPDMPQCHEQFVTTFGRLVFRRPLTAEEIERWTAHAHAVASDEGSFDAGTRSVISGMLQSPYFLYRIEHGTPVPDRDGVFVLDAYELATRLSFFLLDCAPDSGLLDAAAWGALDDEDGIRAAADALLSRFEARAALLAFHDDYLGLDHMGTLPKDIEQFPSYTPQLAQSMAEETRHLVEDVVWTRDADYLEIFDAPYTFVDARLAELYGLPGAAALGNETVRVELPAGERAGILGHASLMSLYAHPDQTSPTRRGRFVREVLLCGSVPDPPAGADTNPPIPEGGTKRELLEQHVADPACAGCHNLMDPIGFALEPLDAIGEYREEDAGYPIDAAAESADLGAFDGVADLGAALRDAPQTRRCVVQTMLRHATGTMESPGTAPAIEALLEAFEASDHNLRDLMVEIAAHESFSHVGAPR